MEKEQSKLDLLLGCINQEIVKKMTFEEFLKIYKEPGKKIKIDAKVAFELLTGNKVENKPIKDNKVSKPTKDKGV